MKVFVTRYINNARFMLAVMFYIPRTCAISRAGMKRVMRAPRIRAFRRDGELNLMDYETRARLAVECMHKNGFTFDSLPENICLGCLYR